MSGPLPTGTARRRNAPTIPTTTLPAEGRKGRPPRPPVGYRFGVAADRWWKWAWRLPQTAAWDDGALYHLARRAQLEDDLHAMEIADLDLAELLGMEQSDVIRQLEFVFGRLKSMASGRMAVMKEMRELDSRLGLNPEALAKLRWTIQAEAAKPEPKAPPTARRLRAV